MFMLTRTAWTAWENFPDVSALPWILELARIPSAISEENQLAIERYIGYKRYERKKDVKAWGG